MSNCAKCGTCEQDCNCIPVGMTTPNYCPSDLPPCPDPAPCSETFDSKCVIYTGEDLDCIGVETGDSVEDVISKLNNKLSPFFCLECTSLIVPANASTNIPYNQTLTWNMVTGATSYDVYFGTNPLSLPLVSPGQILTSYTHPYPLIPDTTYYWKIVPKNNQTSATSCPTYNFKTKAEVCINPLTYVLNHVKSFQSTDVFNTGTFIEDLENYLLNGELITNCDFCCPDCEETKRYVLASAPTYAVYYDTFYNLPSCPPVCCTEVDASLTAMTAHQEAHPSLAEAFAAVPPVTNCCDTNFSVCNQQLKNELGTAVNSIYQTLGVVEESTISGSTELCVLASFLDSLVLTTDLAKADIVSAILNAGLVIQCRPEGTIIANVATYISYVSSVQGLCLCYKPCVIS